MLLLHLKLTTRIFRYQNNLTRIFPQMKNNVNWDDDYPESSYLIPHPPPWWILNRPKRFRKSLFRTLRVGCSTSGFVFLKSSRNWHKLLYNFSCLKITTFCAFVFDTYIYMLTKSRMIVHGLEHVLICLCKLVWWSEGFSFYFPQSANIRICNTTQNNDLSCKRCNKG